MSEAPGMAAPEKRMERLRAGLYTARRQLASAEAKHDHQQQRADALEKQLRELLAVINRDGGQYVDRHGIERSARRARNMIARERAEAADAAELEKQLKAARSELKHWRKNHEMLRRRNRLLLEREDLPVDRTHAHHLVLMLQRMLRHLSLVVNVVDEKTLPVPAESIVKEWRAGTIGRRFIHLKTKGEYVLMFSGKIEADGVDAVIYQSAITGEVWVRPAAEFFDGRFQEIEA